MTIKSWEKACREEEQIQATRFRELREALVASSKASQAPDKNWINPDAPEPPLEDDAELPNF